MLIISILHFSLELKLSIRTAASPRRIKRTWYFVFSTLYLVLCFGSSSQSSTQLSFANKVRITKLKVVFTEGTLRPLATWRYHSAMPKRKAELILAATIMGPAWSLLTALSSTLLFRLCNRISMQLSSMCRGDRVLRAIPCGPLPNGGRSATTSDANASTLWRLTVRSRPIYCGLAPKSIN